MMGWESRSLSLGDVTFISIVALTMRRDIWWSSLQILTACREFGATIDGLKLLQTHQEIVDHPNAKPFTINKGNIEFKNVSFEYPFSREIFSNLNVQIPGGKTTAIVGFSGVGKTTFIHLILRLLQPSSGDILIDKENIKDITHKSLLQNISIIPQEPGLFHRTLLENIRYAKPDATEEEIFKAATIARCHEFILTLDKGYETIVGEQGLKLSSGQRQRIAIARAVLKEAPIVILDEATSALDAFTEAEVQKDLQEFLKGRTTIIITHKLKALVNADHILVFDKGKIIEQGIHEELIEGNGFYKKLWKKGA
jgi:ATP-binding cassette subfamily B protein